MPLFKGQQNLFREEAVEHYLREREGRGILRVSPVWAWVVLAFAGVLLLAFLLFSALAKVDVTERGRGILRPSGGVRLLTAQTSGTVVDLPLRVGDDVKAGQVLVRLSNPQLSGSRLEADRQLALLEKQFPGVARSQDVLYERQRADAAQKIRTLEEDIASFLLTEKHHLSRLEAVRELRRNGISSQIELDQAVDALEGSRRALRSARLALRGAQQEQESLVAQRRQQEYARVSERQTAESRRDVSLLSDQLLQVSAPVDGFLDGLTVRVGDVVAAGQVLAKVVPATVPLEVTVFLPERHRAFVKDGDSVVIELAQFPFQEFGVLKGQILRVGEGLANAGEWREALGESAKEDEPSFRVDIQVAAERPKALGRVKLRPSMLLQARFTLRRQTILSFALDPLRRWLG